MYNDEHHHNGNTPVMGFNSLWNNHVIQPTIASSTAHLFN